jgi:hypothetical protein
MRTAKPIGIKKNTLKVTKPIYKLRIQDASIVYLCRPRLKDNLHYFMIMIDKGNSQT